MTSKVVSAIRAAIILLMITLSLYAEREGLYIKEFHRYLLVELFAVAIITILFFPGPGQLKSIKVDWLAMAFCTGLALYTLASDLFVDKQFRFAGAGVFVVLFLAGYTVLKKNSWHCYLRDFEIAVQAFLLILIAASVLFPVQSRVPGRYSGPIENPSVYALYLCAVWAVLLGRLESQINNKERSAGLFFSTIELFATLILMILSQSLTPMIAMAAVTFLWFFRMVMIRKGARYAVKLFFVIGLLLILALAVLILLIRVNGIGGESRIVQKLQSADISAFLSGRDYYWHKYLRELNVFGHKTKPFLWDHRILPHNAIIGMAYMYGVPCVIPYILMMMMAIEKSFRFANTSVNNASIPFYCIVSFVIMSMADNVEQPFVWLPWIACYLMMAPILIMPVEEIEALKKVNTDICAKEPEQI